VQAGAEVRVPLLPNDLRLAERTCDSGCEDCVVNTTSVEALSPSPLQGTSQRMRSNRTNSSCKQGTVSERYGSGRSERTFDLASPFSGNGDTNFRSL
jgi:hypothetical protein